MASEQAHQFYTSTEWLRCRDAYLKSVGGLCERCRARGLIVPAVIVHHKHELTADNLTDPAITLSPDNLMAVCRECHNTIHNPSRRRYKVDAAGNVCVLTH